MIRAILLLILSSGLPACADRSTRDTGIEAKYDKSTGKLSQLTIKGKTSHMDGRNFVRIEVDENQDGRVDRWEYYGPDQTLEKVGMSRANDGSPDAWAFAGPDGGVSKIEVSTKRDGRVNRIESYERGHLTKAEEDTDGDGRSDKWETYANGVLATASFDPAGTGKPTVTIDYRQTE